MANRRGRTGFTLIELLVVISIIALLIGILLPALGTARKKAQLSVSLANIRQSGQLQNAYSADNKGLIPTFSYEPGQVPQHSAQNRNLALQYATLGTSLADLTKAATLQQMMIFRDAFPRSDWPETGITSHNPFILYSHLITNSYAEIPLPAEYVISPADKVRSTWQNETNEFLDAYLGGTGSYPIEPPDDNTNGRYRWVFSSSYQTVTAAISNDIGAPIAKPDYRVFEKSTSNGYFGAGIRGKIGKRRASEVRSPSSKVYQYENYDRYSGPATIYMGFPEAKVPSLFFDGSAQVLLTGSVNEGWRPNNPLFDGPSYVFNADPVFDTSNTPRTTGLTFRMDQTAFGLQGVDVGGERVFSEDKAQAWLDRIP